MNDINTQGSERIAVLEERSEFQSEQIRELVDAINCLTKEVTSIHQKLQRNMGFFGGVMFAFSLLGACFGAFGSEIVKKIW